MRDQFQGVCRFGRFEGGLFDTEIVVLVNDKQWSRDDTRKPSSFAEGYEQCVKTQPALLAQMKDNLGAPALYIKEIPEWAVRLMAYATCEQNDNKFAHLNVFCKLAKMRHWEITHANHDYTSIKWRFADLQVCNPKMYRPVTHHDDEAYRVVLSKVHEEKQERLKRFKRLILLIAGRGMESVLKLVRYVSREGFWDDACWGYTELEVKTASHKRSLNVYYNLRHVEVFPAEDVT